MEFVEIMRKSLQFDDSVTAAVILSRQTIEAVNIPGFEMFVLSV